MGLFSKDIKTMNDLFVHQLKDIYYAEKLIVASLPKMIRKTTSPELKQGFEKHLAETHEQVKRLEHVFKIHGVEAEAVKCPAIDGIIGEADDVAGEVEDKNVLDAALIAAAQSVEHYEPLRHAGRVGEGTRPEGLRRTSAADARRGNSDRQEADQAGGKPRQSAGGVTAVARSRPMAARSASGRA
jgi:ferritin-like metal-binding protein YciE